MEQITLGRHEVTVVPQRHAYITNKVGRQLGALLEQGADLQDAKSIFQFAVGEGAYGLLAAMIPAYGKRCPRYEFMGFASQEAMDADDYQEEHDHSPDPAQIIGAFESMARVNRFDVLKVLKGIIDPKLIRAQLNLRLAQALEQAETGSSGISASEPSTADGSETSTTSGTTDPTSTESEGSPSPASRSSDEPLSAGV